jgi:HNH endonuclease
MRERGSGTHAKKCRVFLGTEIYSEVLPISKARREALYAPFFDKNGRFKQWSTIKGPRPAMASFEVDEEKLFEGTERRVIATIDERNPAARKRCIDHHGATCCVCAFDFAAVYGEIAQGFIHVHHVKPMSEIGEKYSVDPIKDLVPVCPNCHAVIHPGRKTRGVRFTTRRAAQSDAGVIRPRRRPDHGDSPGRILEATA